jgi:hypothetical protein
MRGIDAYFDGSLLNGKSEKEGGLVMRFRRLIKVVALILMQGRSIKLGLTFKKVC